MDKSFLLPFQLVLRRFEAEVIWYCPSGQPTLQTSAGYARLSWCDRTVPSPYVLLVRYMNHITVYLYYIDKGYEKVCERVYMRTKSAPASGHFDPHCCLLLILLLCLYFSLYTSSHSFLSPWINLITFLLFQENLSNSSCIRRCPKLSSLFYFFILQCVPILVLHHFTLTF